MADWPAGTGRLVLDETDSTMAEAARQAAEGARAPLWILARRQTAGRGRRGRVWAMAEGNLAATLLMDPAAPPAEAALRSFTAALALRDALVAVGAAPARFRLKWPNDLLIDGGKLAGILLETLPGGLLAIGFGVNLEAAPGAEALEPGALPAASLAGATGLRVTPDALLARLAPAFAGWEARLRTGGFAPVRAAWLAEAAGLGQRIRARFGRETREGVFETLDGTGALVLATARGRERIAAAEIQL